MIGKHLKKIRAEKGMTLRQVAEKIGRDHGHISHIENGKFNPEDETIINILIHAFNYRKSQAIDKVAEWRIEDALKKAANPKQVINNIQAGSNSMIITGGQNQISGSFNNK